MAAVGLALRIAIRDARHRDAEQRERDIERRDNEAAQARTLTVETVKRRVGDPATEVHILVINQGSLPLLAVTLEKITITPLDDGPEWAQIVTGGPKAVLGPGEYFSGKVVVRSPHRGDYVDFADGPYTVGGVVSYRDAVGRAWLRWGNTEPYRDRRATDSNRRPPEQEHTIYRSVDAG